ncbi:hypothetical protein NPJ88_000030 [Halomonas elongata]|uniref:hypothetical protein n=1 Tax=Halomonas elongata TaxID=2746 RepID=UPI00255AF0A2|nr:hypothetical protein [Halomonas elongata]MDL4860709.1 hypothetical protein [Halomonas elongata]
MTKESAEPNKAKGIIKGTGKVIALPVTVPFRSMMRSASLAKDSFKRTSESTEALREAGYTISSNIKSSGRKGNNDTFDSVFSGEEGEELRHRNIRRFLFRKRTTASLTLFFAVYGLLSIIMFKQFYGLLTFIGGAAIGLTLALESQYRLWQLRQRRLSREEKGSFSNFWNEEPVWGALNPELGEILSSASHQLLNLVKSAYQRLRGGNQHGK